MWQSINIYLVVVEADKHFVLLLLNLDKDENNLFHV